MSILIPRPYIRKAHTEDALRVTELANQLGYPCTPGQISERLASLPVGHELLVAEDATKGVVGFIHFCAQFFVTEGLSTEVRALVVDEHFRRCGIGKMLLDEVERSARESSAGRVFLYTNISRSEAHKFYERCGYCVSKSEHVFTKVCAH